MLVEQGDQDRAAEPATGQPYRVIAGTDAEIDATARQGLYGGSAAVKIDDLGGNPLCLEQLLLHGDHDGDRCNRLLGRGNAKRRRGLRGTGT